MTSLLGGGELAVRRSTRTWFVWNRSNMDLGGILCERARPGGVGRVRIYRPS
jgi:hypothetical protein